MGDGWLTWAGGKRQRGLAGHKYHRMNTPQKSNSTGSKTNSRKIILKHKEAFLNVGWTGLKASPGRSGTAQTSPVLQTAPEPALGQGQDLWGCRTAQHMGAQAHSPWAGAESAFRIGQGYS